MYSLKFTRSTLKQARRIPKPFLIRIRQQIDSLKTNPFPIGSKKLRASQNYYRIRTGDYRVIYSVDKVIKIITIRKIGHRRDIYKA